MHRSRNNRRLTRTVWAGLLLAPALATPVVAQVSSPSVPATPSITTTPAVPDMPAANAPAVEMPHTISPGSGTFDGGRGASGGGSTSIQPPAPWPGPDQDSKLK